LVVRGLSLRSTGITAYLANGGALEHAQEMAAHEVNQSANRRASSR
jgi:hypothetical protein